MNIILFSRRIGRAHSLSLNHPFALAGVAAAVLGLLGVAFAVGMQLGQHNGARLASSTPGQLAMRDPEAIRDGGGPGHRQDPERYEHVTRDRTEPEDRESEDDERTREGFHVASVVTGRLIKGRGRP